MCCTGKDISIPCRAHRQTHKYSCANIYILPTIHMFFPSVYCLCLCVYKYRTGCVRLYKSNLGECVAMRPKYELFDFFVFFFAFCQYLLYNITFLNLCILYGHVRMYIEQIFCMLLLWNFVWINLPSRFGVKDYGG